MTWDGTSVRTYKNGALSSTVAGGRSLTGAQFFGARWNNVESYDGIIDEIRLYDRALLDTEIAGLAERAPGARPFLSYDIEHLNADRRQKELSGYRHHR